MYLKSFTLTNFRKFGEENNTILLAYDKFRDQEKKKEVNISTTSTLIVGKNNVGKTSVISALKKLLEKDSFASTDFNFRYLMDFLENYNSGSDNVILPEMSFIMNIELDDQDDIISNIAPLLFLDNTESAVLHIKVSLKEAEEFKERVKEILNKEKAIRFKLLLKAIDDVGLETTYFNHDNQKIKKFKLKELIEIKPIEANKITKQDSLTKAFNKIIEFRYKNDKKTGNPGSNIDKEIEEINNKLTTNFEEHHEGFVNDSLGEIQHIDKLKIKLTSNLTHDNLLEKNILLYEYVEKGLAIPENQYGLGYTNLVLIIAEIIEYIEKSPEGSFTSKINLISIEEPENYMHPQMQELFIRNINDAIRQLLESQNKYVNSQIIITTHSSHILNSKIHSGNSFNYMNYFTLIDNNSEIVHLQDNTIVDGEVKVFSNKEKKERKKENLNFLKKHIKYKVSELFFSDAVIFVEGVTEEILLKHWIENDKILQFYYISIFNINGAHGLVYHNLIKQLKVPSLIITDLDIKKSGLDKSNKEEQEQKGSAEKKDEKGFEQVKSLEKLVTTNQTLINYFQDELKKFHEDDRHIEENLYLTYQIKIDEYYPTSFEEALILTNYENKVLKNSLEATIPQIYKKEHAGVDENLKHKSRLFQEKLSRSKSEFANCLLFELMKNEKEQTKLDVPNYIKDGLEWLQEKLEGD